jgi:carboxyl-terminal processing protease
MGKRFWLAGFLIFSQIIFTFAIWVAPAHALTDEQKLFNEAWRIVNRAYVDETFNDQNWWMLRQKALQKPLRSREETYTAIQTMLASLDDPFTRFLRPSQYRSLQVSTAGELTGIGLQIALDAETGHLQVIAPIEGSPADKAGILPRDRIVSIDGTPSEALTLDDAATRMRGPAGSKVVLTIERDGESPRSLTIVRDRIELNPVVAKLDRTSAAVPVGYIRLTQFNANATTELAEAVRDLERQGAQEFVLDLRNNSGGLLQAGIEIARLWLDEGTIVYTVNRQSVLDSYESTGSALTQAPLVVLVNRGTASASEILAGALQDNGRAQLVGETTFGKGLIQSLFELSDGSGLAVTVAKYETPNHHDINKLGIQPDVPVALERLEREEVATADDPQYRAAIALLEETTVLADAPEQTAWTQQTASKRRLPFMAR